VNDRSRSQVSVRRVPQVRSRIQEETLAWAMDSKTRKLRYILELRPEENGAACGCECISCGHPLQAVNAGKSVFQVRPHYRHEAGAETARCQTLSARAALLCSLKEGDWITLPRLKKAVTVQGLSGSTYEGWFEIEPALVQIASLRIVDTTIAEVVLDDGRRFEVVVTGVADSNLAANGSSFIPRIEIATDDPRLAAMDPDELRGLLVPAVQAGRWCSHWPAPELENEARLAATRAAIDALDWVDGDLPELLHLPVELRRESLLHREVKAILAEARRIQLPGWIWTSESITSTNNKLMTVPTMKTVVPLVSARLEKKLGRIIPDVIAQLSDGSELLIEVTVTNTITAERKERISAVDLPTIEIDFSQMAGTIHRDRLRTLVLEEVTGKHWLHQPESAQFLMVPRSIDLLIYGDRQKGYPGRRRNTVQDSEPDESAGRYLYAVKELAHLDHVIDKDSVWDWEQDRQYAYNDVLTAADELTAHGFPEATDYRLFDDGHTVLHRVMSIESGKPVGYKYNTVWQVINTILTDVGAKSRSWHGLYLIAIQAYAPKLTAPQEVRIAKWRAEVRASIQAGEKQHLRDPRYDALLGLLFPKMRDGLTKPKAKLLDVVDAPTLVRCDDSQIDPTLFSLTNGDAWRWTTSYEDRIRELELAASRARNDDWMVGIGSVLYQLTQARFGPAPWIVVEHVSAKTAVDNAIVWRYLCREGLIELVPRRRRSVT